eukprot:189184-Prymnesium_polylepis.1
MRRGVPLGARRRTRFRCIDAVSKACSRRALSQGGAVLCALCYSLLRLGGHAASFAVARMVPLIGRRRRVRRLA